jgi:hypothetical protein
VDPLSMFGYEIGIMLLIYQLKKEPPWSSNPVTPTMQALVVYFPSYTKFFELLQEIGPSYGYFPELSKSILAVRAHKN